MHASVSKIKTYSSGMGGSPKARFPQQTLVTGLTDRQETALGANPWCSLTHSKPEAPLPHPPGPLQRRGRLSFKDSTRLRARSIWRFKDRGRGAPRRVWFCPETGRLFPFGPCFQNQLRVPRAV